MSNNVYSEYLGTIMCEKQYEEYKMYLENANENSVVGFYESKKAIEKLPRSITWFVTWACNYKCPFCWELADEAKYRGEISRLNMIQPQEWANGINKLKPNEIYFTGGEPTIYKKLPEVMELLDKSIKFKMTTNFGETFNIEEYKNFIVEKRFSVLGISYHPSEVDETSFFRKVEDFIEIGVNELCDFGIEMVLYPNDLDKADYLLDFAEKHNIKVMLDNYCDPKNKYIPSKEASERIIILQDRAKNNNARIKRLRKVIDTNSAATFSELVLYGAGNNGLAIAEAIQDKDIIKCFADINKAGNNYKNIRVLHPNEAIKEYPNAVFGITLADMDIVLDIVDYLRSLGVPKDNIKILRLCKEKAQFVRGKEPIWCPARSSVLHIDQNGNVYACMRGIKGNKENIGRYPHHNIVGNIFDGDICILNEPIVCEESFKCSRCDWELIQSGMYNVL